MIGMVLDVAIVVLLLVTIGYCVALSRKLRRLKADEAIMRTVVTELVDASARAEHAVRALKATAKECDETLGRDLQAAREMAERLGIERQNAEEVFSRLARITGVARETGLITPKPTGAQPAEGEAPISALAMLRSRAA